MIYVLNISVHSIIKKIKKKKYNRKDRIGNWVYKGVVVIATKNNYTIVK